MIYKCVVLTDKKQTVNSRREAVNIACEYANRTLQTGYVKHHNIVEKWDCIRPGVCQVSYHKAGKA